MGSGHQRDLLALRIVALGSFEVSANCRRMAPRLLGRLSDELADNGGAFARNVTELILVA